MDSEIRDFISGEFAKVYERLDAHGERLAKHEDSDTYVRASVNELASGVSALANTVSTLTSKVDRIGTYAATIHDDVKLLLRAHPEL